MTADSITAAQPRQGAAAWLWTLAALATGLPWLLQFAGSEAPALWWASRAYGFVSYVALWLSMLTGVLVGAKGIDGWIDRKVLLDLHQQWTLAGLIATVLHVFAVLTNAHADIGLAGALVPFASERLRAQVGVGVVSFWALALVCTTSWLRTHISYPLWRGVHAMAFGAFVLALVHSVSSGTDTGFMVVRWLYIGSGSLLAGAMVTRMLLALGRRRA
jgi:sulfoxide reductase heme-binding subunit YedZ